VDLNNNRFLILQGEVEQISMMKPKGGVSGNDEGLLEYLEDIIGTNQYVEHIDTKAKSLEELNGRVVTPLPGCVRLVTCATRTRLMGCTHSRGVSDWIRGSSWLSSVEPCFDAQQ
jgi:hypothetical protein